MRAWPLIRETYSRSRSTPIVHAVAMGVYLLLAMWGAQAGDALALMGGILLAMVLSRGIIGDDISSGRMRTLATKPFWIGQLYIWRVVGLVGQFALHAGVACGVFWLVAHARPSTKIDHLGLYATMAVTLFAGWTTLSATLSVVLGRGLNSLVLVLLWVLTLFARLLLQRAGGPAADAALAAIRFGLPPQDLLLGAIGRGDAANVIARNVGYAWCLAGAYAAVGLVLLSRREFTGPRD